MARVTVPVLVGIVVLLAMFVGVIALAYVLAFRPEWRRRREQGRPMFEIGRRELPYVIAAVVLIVVGVVLLNGH